MEKIIVNVYYILYCAIINDFHPLSEVWWFKIFPKLDDKYILQKLCKTINYVTR